MKRSLLFVTILITAVFNCAAQIKELNIGDTVPDIEFDTVINYNRTSLKLSDFRGKLVILDLWNTTCGPCVADLPRKDLIQKKFKDKVVILPIAFFSADVNDSIAKDWRESIIPQFWRNNRNTKGLSLPAVIDSKHTVTSNFPVVGPGLQIWIDKNGILIGLTSDEYVNSKEINKVLNNEPINWVIWKRIKFDVEKPLASFSSDLINTSMSQYSLFYPHLNYVGSYSKFQLDTNLGQKRYTSINNSIIALYSFAYSIYRKVTPYTNRIIINTNDSSIFFKQGEYYENWWANNSYCYEKAVPIENNDTLFAAGMLEDLDKFLNLKSSIKITKVHCKILRNVQDTLYINQLAKLKKDSEYSYSFEEFLHDLNVYIESFPILLSLESKIDNKKEIYMKTFDWKNQQQIMETIRDNGLMLVDSTVDIPMIILQNK